MKILTVGDVVGAEAVAYLKKELWNLRKAQKIDFCVVNGENADNIHGISTQNAADLLDSGADLITLGNHAFQNKSIFSMLESDERILRPANFPASAPGVGFTVANLSGTKILCINVCGRIHMDPLDCPFQTVDKILEREQGNYDVALMDIHADATSEKLAIAHAFDGKIKVMFGTHTHVQTADEQMLPKGSLYITDLGMCGPVNSIIGSDIATVIQKFRTMMPARMSVPNGGNIRATGAVFDTDKNTVSRIVF